MLRTKSDPFSKGEKENGTRTQEQIILMLHYVNTKRLSVTTIHWILSLVMMFPKINT